MAKKFNTDFSFGANVKPKKFKAPKQSKANHVLGLLAAGHMTKSRGGKYTYHGSGGG